VAGRAPLRARAAILARVDEKTAKPKRDTSEAMKQLAAMDFDAITASTVLARMASAGDPK
jgi:hypothetical protein